MKLNTKPFVILFILLIMAVVVYALIPTIQETTYKATHGGQTAPLDTVEVSCSVTVANPRVLSSKIESAVCEKSQPMSRYDCRAPITSYSLFSDQLTLKFYAENKVIYTKGFAINEGARKQIDVRFCASEYIPNIRGDLYSYTNLIGTKVVTI